MTGIKNAFSSADDVWKAQYQACMHIFYSSYILERHENCYYLQKAATNTFSKTSYVPHPFPNQGEDYHWKQGHLYTQHAHQS